MNNRERKIVMADADRIAAEVEAAYAERRAQLSGAPWTGTPEEVHDHYASYTSSLGQTSEYVDAAAARDWAENGNPSEGERHHPNSEYSWRGGSLWSDGKYLGADGSAEPYVAWAPPRGDEQAAGRAR